MVAPPGVHGIIHGTEYGPSCRDGGAYSPFFLPLTRADWLCGKIPQVYLHFPAGAGEPPSVLRGFTDVELRPGEGKIVNVTLSRYDLSVWDVRSQSWTRASGTYSLSVGTSSRDFRLEGTLPL